EEYRNPERPILFQLCIGHLFIFSQRPTPPVGQLSQDHCPQHISGEIGMPPLIETVQGFGKLSRTVQFSRAKTSSYCAPPLLQRAPRDSQSSRSIAGLLVEEADFPNHTG